MLLCVAWAWISEKLNLDQGRIQHVFEQRYYVQQRINGAWVNRATNQSENSAWNLAQKYRSEENYAVRICDTSGSIIATL
jgi:hypothetical protein